MTAQPFEIAMSNEPQNFPHVSFDGFQPILDRWFQSLGAGDSIFITAETEPHFTLHFRITKFYQSTKLWVILPKRKATEQQLLSRLEELSSEFDELSVDHRARSVRLSSPITPSTTADLAAQAAQSGFEGLGYDHSSQFTMRCDQAPVLERAVVQADDVFVPYPAEERIGRWLDSAAGTLSQLGVGRPPALLRKAMTCTIGLLSVAALFPSSVGHLASPITKMLFWTYSLWWLVLLITHLIFGSHQKPRSMSEKHSWRELFWSLMNVLVRSSVLLVASAHAKLSLLWTSFATFWLLTGALQILTFVHVSRLLKARADSPMSAGVDSTEQGPPSPSASRSLYWSRRFFLVYPVIFVVWCWAWLTN